jgi:uncharacterized protein
MQRRALRSLATCALLASCGVVLGADSAPPPPTRHFDDRAGLVSRDVAERLDAKLVAFEAKTGGSQIVVSIFPALPSPSLEDFTVRTAQAWRVGRKGLDSGAVLFVFVKEKKLRIEVGYGLEGKIPDAVAKRILDDVITPELKAGRSAEALEAGVEALMAAAEGREMKTSSAAAADAVPPPAPESPPPTSGDELTGMLHAVATRRVLGIPLIYPAGFFGLALLTLLIRFPAIGRRMRRGHGFFTAWLIETFQVLSWIASNAGTTYSGGSRSSGSSGGYSGGGGRFGGGGASGGW